MEDFDEVLIALAELGDVICEVPTITGRGSYVGAVFTDWPDALSTLRTGSFDIPAPHVAKFPEDAVEVDGIEYTVLLYWPSVKWDSKSRAEFKPISINRDEYETVLTPG